MLARWTRSFALVLVALVVAPTAVWAGWEALGSDGAGEGPLGDHVEHGCAVTSLASDANHLYVGGNFTNAFGDPNADHFAVWNGKKWSSVGNGDIQNVWDIEAIGKKVYLAARIGGNQSVFQKKGQNWVPLGLDNVWALASLGGDLIAGGSFQNAGGNQSADYIARWNGKNWVPLPGSGVIGDGVTAMTVHNGDLYVGGGSANVAMWDGQTWTAIGQGLGDQPHPNAMAFYDGSLYVGGGFINAFGNADIDEIARWDGSSWSAVIGTNGSKIDLSGSIHALFVYQGELYAGGVSQVLDHWDGSRWQELTPGAVANHADEVLALAQFDGALIAGFYGANLADIPEADCIAAWTP